MRTSSKLTIWAICVLTAVGLGKGIQWSMNQPSGVHQAIVVEVTGCGNLDFALCTTTVDMHGVRLLRSGKYGSVGDTILVTQRQNARNWDIPTPRRLAKYREEQRVQGSLHK